MEENAEQAVDRGLELIIGLSEASIVFISWINNIIIMLCLLT